MPDAAPARIMVIDDLEANREMLRHLLRRLGYAVVEASSGEAGLQRLADEPIDLLLLDVMMPGMNGFQVLERLRADPARAELPVIVISALDDMSSIARCIELGAVDYLTKPFDLAVLRARVGATIEKKRLRDREHEALAQLRREKEQVSRLLDLVVPIGADLALERDFARLLVKIVESGRLISGADSGVLYLRTGEDRLETVVVLQAALGLFLTGADEKPPAYAPFVIREAALASAAGEAVQSLQPIVVADLPAEAGFPHDRARAEALGIAVQSLAAIPVRSSSGGAVGVLEFSNARDDAGAVVAFSGYLLQLLQALATLAAAALEGYLRQEAALAKARVAVQVDAGLRAAQVSEVSESEYFQRLKSEVQRLRRRGPSA